MSFQSLVVADTPMPTNVVQQQTVTFSDDSRGEMGGMAAHPEAPKPMRDIGLSEFLSRPTQIAQAYWSHQTSIGNLIDVNPWHLFFNNAIIKRKIENYAFIRCNLKIKIVINASPFSYGAALASYRPLAGYWSDNVYGILTLNDFILKSQRPHLWIYPQTCSGGEMTLPFLAPVDWLRVSVASDFTNMGKLQIDNATGLWSVNSTAAPSGKNVSIQVYAWAEDVEVSGPTYGLAMQSKVTKDEYGTGIISAPASAVAEAAGRLKDVPGIGKLATATQIGATAVSKMSSLFGFSNRVNLEGSTSYQPRAFPNMANCGLEFPTDKLTLDAKNELSVDPGALGLSDEDELNIQHLCNRDTFIDALTWSFNANDDGLLFSSRVNPRMFSSESVVGAKAIAMTPMCWVSSMFRQWRGDLVFRFRFICTQFHKGRAYISYDPYGLSGSNIVSASGNINAVKTVIVDLSKDTDVEVKVPYQQNTPYLLCNDSFSSTEQPWSLSNAPGSYAFKPGEDNGMITLRVLNVLTAPNQDNINNGIIVLVSVRGENMEFANPYMSGTAPLSWFAPQSKVDDVVAENSYDLGIAPSIKSKNLLVMGERITSLREVLNRRTLNVVVPISMTTSTDAGVFREIMGPMPRAYGYDPGGLEIANKQATGTAPFNFSYNGFLNWITPAFIGRRGAVDWTINFDGLSSAGHIRVYRTPFYNTTYRWTATIAAPTENQAAAFFRNTIPHGNGTAGSVVTNQATQAVVNYSAPMYGPYKFKPTEPKSYTNYATFGAGDDAVVIEVTKPPGSIRSGFLEMYCGAGTDFSLLFFCNVPTLWLYDTQPAAA